MTIAVRMSDCGTGSANCSSGRPSVISGGFARVTPAADRIKILDPFDNRLRPMISWAKRRLSIRYKPDAYSTPATTASKSSMSLLDQNCLGQREHDGQDDPNHRQKHTNVEHQRSADRDHHRSDGDRCPQGRHEGVSGDDRR